MLELTMMMLIAALGFFILRIIFKSDELNCMSVIMCVIALALVLQDDELSEDLIYFVIPLFYGIAMSAISLMHIGERERK